MPPLSNFIGAFGLCTFIALAWSISETRRRFPWRTVAAGLALQFILAWLVLRTETGAWFFGMLAAAVNRLRGFAIEGVAMVAEESKDPQRTIPIGYISGIATLAFLAIGIMVVSGGITDWHRLANIDYPLPEAIGIVMGKDSSLTKLFAGIGLFGLIASFHSIILGYSRQLVALARGGYLPRGVSRGLPRFHTPLVALFVW